MTRIGTVAALVVWAVALGGCAESQYFGLAERDQRPAGVSITPGRAVELAGPFLDKSFELRRTHRRAAMNLDTQQHLPREYVVLRDGWYYVTRDNYPATDVDFYLAHAVRVDAQTGKVMPPE